MTKCYAGKDHQWIISPNQSDTGTKGVREECSKCHKTITKYNSDLHKELESNPGENQRLSE